MVSDLRVSPRHPWIFPATALFVAILPVAGLVAAATCTSAPLSFWGCAMAVAVVAGYSNGALFVRRPVRGVLLTHLLALVVAAVTMGPYGVYFLFCLPLFWVPFGVGWVGGRSLARWIYDRAGWRMARAMSDVSALDGGIQRSG